MKAVPLIVLAVLVILPFAVRFFYTISRLSTKNSDKTIQPSPDTTSKLEQFFRMRPRLAYTASALYFLLLIAAVLWLFLSFIPDLGLPQTAVIYGVVLMFIILIGLAAELYIWFRYVRKKISFPNRETTPEARLEWENKYADLYYKNILRMMLIGMGFSLLIFALLAITVYYFA